MDAWTQASLVPELQPIFGKKFTIQSSPSYQPGSSNTPTFAEGGEYNPDDIQSIDPNKPLTDKEQKFIAEKLHGKWHVNPSDKAAMKKTFFNNLAAGIALGVVGTTLQSVGAGVMGGLMSSAPYYGSDGYYHIDTVKLIVGAVVGANILTAGTIIGPLCAVPFVYAGHTGNIYKKTTGQKLFAAASRVSLGGGYDWENKEVQVAMAIRL